MAGLGPTGFVTKTYDEIRVEIETAILADISDKIDIATASPMGQLIKLFSERERALWELLEAVYASQYPDSASGFSLASVASITGTIQEPATYSEVLANLTLAAGTYSAGTLVAYPVGAPERQFANVSQVVSPGGVVTGVLMRALTTGPLRADAGTLTAFVPVAGWTAITNPADATLGKLIESDTELRIRRVEELAQKGSTHAAAIAADLLLLDDVEAAIVVPNDTDGTDGDGIPPHSIRAIVLGGDAVEIATTILTSKAAGIGTYGASSEVIEDSQGLSHDVNYDRPTTRNVYLSLSVLIDEELYGGDFTAAATLIKEALVDFGDRELSIDDDVIRSRLIAEVFTVPGVLDVTAFTLGFSASPVGTTNLAIATYEIADLDTARIVVTQV